MIAMSMLTNGTGAFVDGADGGSTYADFDQAFDPINASNSGNGTSRYTVGQGDTLQSIAASLFGDASLWYIIGEANGLTSSSALTAGQSLTIPGKISNFHNNADTFRPYDASKAIGDTQPTTPRPPKKPGCGVIGAVILAAAAVAVAVILKVPVTQAFSATTTVGTATVGAGIAGIGAVTATATAATLSTLGAIGAGAAIGAAAATASQLVGVATGLQNKFSFKGVALAALAGGVVADVGGAVDRRFAATGAATGVGPRSVAGYAQQTLAGAAAALAGAGARSLITGSSFGDNILAALPDVIGQTVGSVVANAATSPTARITNATTENATLRDEFAAATTSAQLSGLVVSVANLSLPSALRLVQFIDQPEESLFARGVAAITDVTGAIADRARVLADTLIGVVRDPEAALDEIVVTARRSATDLLDRGGSYLNSLRDISITNAINTINGLGGASRGGVRFGSAARGTVITTRGGESWRRTERACCDTSRRD